MESYSVYLILAAAAVLAVTIALYMFFSKDGVSSEEFYSPPPPEEESGYQFINEEEEEERAVQDSSSPAACAEPSASDPNGNEVFKSFNDVKQESNQLPTDCYPKDQLTPEELLPGDANSAWAQVNPAGQGDLRDKNFLEAGHHIGVNTVGQSLRNPNLQLRSEPPNPQVKVSPWAQTTIEPDTNRRPMEVGGS
jgi:hypothetical protein